MPDLTPSRKPHDHFFRATFSEVAVVRDYLTHFIPKSLSERLDLTSLHRENGSFLDQKLAENLSDIIYSCQYGKEKVKISILFEHKSYVEAMPWLQLLRYLLNAYEEQRKAQPPPKRLTPVIPVVVYHGKQKWKLRPVISDFTGIDEQIKAFIPGFDYLLTDLSQFSEEELMSMENNWVKNSFMALKLSRHKAIVSRMNDIFWGLDFSETNELSSRIIQRIILYLFQVSDIKQDPNKVFENLDDSLKRKAMTIYDRAIQEGVTKGIEQGKEMGKEIGNEDALFKVFKNGLDKGMSIADLISLTGITMEKALAWKKKIEEEGEK
ncbi:MAG: Rpn family recombination-promoting nuclease/putative transposase [Bacteroidia bacterium]|nr:Rpn family recombination-promoting nuclease/putative transposase [Bacteroidia bacterium]